MLPQIVLEVLPQIMQLKLGLFLEEKPAVSVISLSQSTPHVNKNLNQDIYCGGIVYHYLHPNQTSTITREKLATKITAKSKCSQKLYRSQPKSNTNKRKTRQRAFD